MPAAIWLLLIISPPRTADLPVYVSTVTAVLLGLALLERLGPGPRAPLAARIAAFAAELALCFAVVQLHGTYIRPALIYLVPTMRALSSFGELRGVIASLAVWLAYGINVSLAAWPDRLGDFPNYFSFFLAPYVIAIALTYGLVRQAGERQRLQALYDELSEAHGQLQDLHQQGAELVVTQERNRLAREIHDSLAHYLTVLTIQLEAADKLGASQPERALDHVRRSRRLASDCLEEVRRSVAALRASTLDELSLPHALEKLAAEFGGTTGLAVDLDVNVSEDARLAPETAMALYRAAQEGLTNVQRHARASRVRISLRRREGSLELLVRDDGIGPSGASSSPGLVGGFGLLGLQERVALLGGELELATAPAGGALLSVRLPG
ncbi:MAG: sensor histidine kinase [Chloroflexi bacterium]|nr:sensor histidine kinase [Chloroflexota bacterium]